MDGVKADVREAFVSASQILHIVSEKETLGYSYPASNSNQAIFSACIARFEVLIADLLQNGSGVVN